MSGRNRWGRREPDPERRDERGSITPFVVIVSLGILMLAALVIDGGRQLNAKGRAIAYAQEAARAGAQAVDLTDPRLDLLPGRAVDAADTYCDQARAADPQLVRCTARITTVHDPAGDFLAVRVTARVQVDAILLGIVDRPVLRATGQALARPVSGISSADSGKQATIGPPRVGLPSDMPYSTAPPDLPGISVSPCVPSPTATSSPTATTTGTGKPGGPGTGKPTGKPSESVSPTPSPSPTLSYCASPADE